MNKRYLGAAALAALTLAGCGQNEAPITMAPPTTPVTISQGAGGGGGQMTYSPDQVFPWNQTPANQQIPIVRATFDQGGYQLFDNTGDTIVIPFQNQNMYVMKFGRSNTGAMYFVNDGQVPTLYVPNGGALENASAQGARWYPFPQNYAYTQPVYVGLAPSWAAFTGMGWYPGMSYYGGYWGMNPYGYGGGFAPMIGLHFLIGGHPYYGFNSYHSYYTSHPYNAVRTRNVYNNYTSFRSSAPFGARRSTFGNSGSYGSRPSGGFGRTSSGGGGFGRPSGSFGGGSSTFGSGGRQTGGSFGSRPSGYGGSFGTGRRTFGGSSGGSSFGGSRPSGGGSFGGFGGRSSGGGSFGGGSFGGGRSFGGFGGRRR